ncbi:hypothetical protein BRC90_01165 [Halobacteriales archaeon QS_4_69_34]|nr:MAG: hypothetical protein BRC90_01165 [Halobacteriales archaeon QS_4_69_34]
MDALTHVFLPLLTAYAFRPDSFSLQHYLPLGLFGLLADLDKLVGLPGLLHSLVTLVPICVSMLVLERFLRGGHHYSIIASAFTLSHLLLDIIEGVTVPLLYPAVTTGVGISYPMELLVGPGAGPFWFAVDGPPAALDFGGLRTGHAASEVTSNEFGFINGYGVATTLTFVLVFVSREYFAIDPSSIGADGDDE